MTAMLPDKYAQLMEITLESALELLAVILHNVSKEIIVSLSAKLIPQDVEHAQS